MRSSLDPHEAGQVSAQMFSLLHIRERSRPAPPLGPIDRATAPFVGGGPHA